MRRCYFYDLGLGLFPDLSTLGYKVHYNGAQNVVHCALYPSDRVVTHVFLTVRNVCKGKL